MRIVHISCVAPPEGGGIGSVAYQEVLRLRRMGEDAVLIAPDSEAQDTSRKMQGDEDGFIIRLPAWRIGNGARLKGLEARLRDADVVHLHYPFYFTAGFVARLRREDKIKRLVLTLHMDARAGGMRGLFFGIHRKLFQKRIIDSADLLLVSTLDYARHSSFAPWAEDLKMRELPFGVDTDIFKPSDDVDPGYPYSAFHIPPSVSVVGTVSVMDRAHPFKGVDMLLKAASRLPDVHLLLVGDGDKRGDYEKMAADLGIKDRAHFVGRLGRPDLVKALQAMDVFAFPSTSGAEAFGLAMLEAMACGTPVVASDLPGVRQVAEGAGVIAKPGNVEDLAAGLSRMLRDDDMRRGYGFNARKKALGYNWEMHAERLSDFYKEICA